MKQLTVSLVGLGNIGRKDHLPAILESQKVHLDSVCDIDDTAVQEISDRYKTRGFNTVDEMLAQSRPDLAVVALPHDVHIETVSKLADAGINILKEKPFATTLVEARALKEIIAESKIKLLTATQRRYDPIFKEFQKLRQKIGNVFYFDTKYTLNINDLSEGWRSSKERAGGGCLIDMGYHTVDQLVWYFGVPQSVHSILSGKNRENQDYDVEDTCAALLNYGDVNGNKFFGSILLSRVAPEKKEYLQVMGTRGSILMTKMSIKRLGRNGEFIEGLDRSALWPSASVDQLDHFVDWIHGTHHFATSPHDDHFANLAIIESAYKSNDQSTPVDPSTFLTSFHSS